MTLHPLNPVPDGVNVEEELTARLENGVLWLTINRADKGNAVPYYVRDRLTQHFWEAHADLEVRAIVLTGAASGTSARAPTSRCASPWASPSPTARPR